MFAIFKRRTPDTKDLYKKNKDIILKLMRLKQTELIPFLLQINTPGIKRVEFPAGLILPKRIRVPAEIVALSDNIKTKVLLDELLSQLTHLSTMNERVFETLSERCRKRPVPYKLYNGSIVDLTSALMATIKESMNDLYHLGIFTHETIPLTMFKGLTITYDIDSKKYTLSPAHSEASVEFWCSDKENTLGFLKNCIRILRQALEITPNNPLYMRLSILIDDAIKIIEKHNQDKCLSVTLMIESPALTLENILRDDEGKREDASHVLRTNPFYGACAYNPENTVRSDRTHSLGAETEATYNTLSRRQYAHSISTDLPYPMPGQVTFTPTLLRKSEALKENTQTISFQVAGSPSPVRRTASKVLYIPKKSSIEGAQAIQSANPPLHSEEGLLKPVEQYGYSVCFPNTLEQNRLMEAYNHILQVKMSYTFSNARSYYVGSYSREQRRIISMAGGLFTPILQSTSRNTLFPVFPDIIEVQFDGPGVSKTLPKEYICFHTDKQGPFLRMFYYLPEGLRLEEGILRISAIPGIRAQPVIIGKQPWELTELKFSDKRKEKTPKGAARTFTELEAALTDHQAHESFVNPAHKEVLAPSYVNVSIDSRAARSPYINCTPTSSAPIRPLFAWS